MRWVGHVACMGYMRSAYRVFVGRYDAKRPLGRPSPKCYDNIIIDLQ